MKRHAPELARQLYARAPDIDAMRRHLPDIGDSLNTAAINLAVNITVEGIDAFLAKLKGAETSLMHLRRALAADQSPGIHSHGTG
jgi:hypothetical protein